MFLDQECQVIPPCDHPYVELCCSLPGRDYSDWFEEITVDPIDIFIIIYLQQGQFKMTLEKLLKES